MTMSRPFIVFIHYFLNSRIVRVSALNCVQLFMWACTVSWKNRCWNLCLMCVQQKNNTQMSSFVRGSHGKGFHNRDNLCDRL